MALTKNENLVEAAKAYQRAVELDSDDPETWANLGGLQRRLARIKGGAEFDWPVLRQARDAYEQASKLRANDTYSLVNMARLDLLLAADEPEKRPPALTELRKLENLARYEAYAPERPDPWKLIDLADTLLLTGRTDAGLAELRAAIELIDPAERESYLTSAVGPLRDFLTVDVLDEPTAAGVREAVRICTEAIKAAQTGPAE